jgi:hypothetical protein
MFVLRTVVRPALLYVALLALAGPAPAQFSATKYIETGVSYPGIGTFSQFGAPPSLFNGTVAFVAQQTTGARGVFTATPGTPTAVATTGTPIPGGVSNFFDFAPYPPALSASGVAFFGNGPPGPGNIGAFSNVTGSLAPVVNNVTPYPFGPGPFTGSGPPALSGQTAVFWGTNGPPGSATGVFFKSGSNPLGVLAVVGGPIPGGPGNFTSFTNALGQPINPSISGSNVVFGGQGAGRIGLFALLPQTTVVVATNATAAPGGTGNFSDFGPAPVIDGTTVAFHGASPGRTGVYIWSGAAPVRVADTTTAVPGGVGNFSSFAPLSISLSGGRVTFRGVGGTGQAGIYTGVPGALQKVVAVGETIDGKTVNFVDTAPFASSGLDTAVLLGFTNGSFGVYTFSPVPEPAGLLALGAVGLAAARAWRRRRAPVA